MKRILLIGNSPLPHENELVRPAAGLRTYQFLKPLAERFGVRLVTIAMPECYKGEVVEGENEAVKGKTEMVNGEPEAVKGKTEMVNGERDVVKGESEKYSHFQISKNNPYLKKILQEIHDEFQPEAIIAVNTQPSYMACCLHAQAPLWADLNGWIMAEAQAQAYKMASNDYLSHYSEMERIIVGRADKLSAVSEAESFALLGELACAGRLNKESFGYKFVEHVPNGMEWFDVENENSILPIKIPKEAFVLLWVGGYNTWVDEFTLFKALSSAMQKCEKLYFVSTGGGIAGLDNSTFAKFKKMIEGSEFKERFIFLGWMETAAIPALYKRAQAGINTDRRCVETLTGARNRINEMMKFGLPVLTTRGSEIAGEIGRVGAGIAVKTGDHSSLAGAIEELYAEWRGGGGRETAKFKEYGKKGREYIEQYCNYEKTLQPLLTWLENPRPAPDRGVRASGMFGRGGYIGCGGGRKFAAGGFFGKLRGWPGLGAMWRYLKQNGFKKSFKKFLQKLMG